MSFFIFETEVLPTTDAPANVFSPSVELIISFFLEESVLEELVSIVLLTSLEEPLLILSNDLPILLLWEELVRRKRNVILLVREFRFYKEFGIKQNQFWLLCTDGQRKEKYFWSNTSFQPWLLWFSQMLSYQNKIGPSRDLESCSQLF